MQKIEIWISKWQKKGNVAIAQFLVQTDYKITRSHCESHRRDEVPATRATLPTKLVT